MVEHVGMSGTERELSAMYRRLPHGPHGMGRDAVASHQRARLFGAMIEAIHRQGYKGTTVAHVIALAGVSGAPSTSSSPTRKTASSAPTTSRSRAPSGGCSTAG